LESSNATVPEDGVGIGARISSSMRRTSRNAAIETRGAPRTMAEQAARSNIQAGMTTPASSASVQTKTSSPPRLSR
jgi:hypothetical protein